jgi:hypothetical protein
MQIYFTKEEQKYVIIKDDGDYGFACRDDAPEKIRKSIMEKIAAHKRWLEDGGRK